MKRMLVLLSTVLLVAMSCDKLPSSYYVRYEAVCQYPDNSAVYMKVLFDSPDGQQIINVDSPMFSEICGPFYKGDRVSLQIQTTTKVEYAQAAIYVSKNGNEYCLIDIDNNRFDPIVDCILDW